MIVSIIDNNFSKVIPINFLTKKKLEFYIVYPLNQMKILMDNLTKQIRDLHQVQLTNQIIFLTDNLTNKMRAFTLGDTHEPNGGFHGQSHEVKSNFPRMIFHKR